MTPSFSRNMKTLIQQICLIWVSSTAKLGVDWRSKLTNCLKKTLRITDMYSFQPSTHSVSHLILITSFNNVVQFNHPHLDPELEPFFFPFLNSALLLLWWRPAPFRGLALPLLDLFCLRLIGERLAGEADPELDRFGFGLLLGGDLEPD